MLAAEDRDDASSIRSDWSYEDAQQRVAHLWPGVPLMRMGNIGSSKGSSAVSSTGSRAASSPLYLVNVDGDTRSRDFANKVLSAVGHTPPSGEGSWYSGSDAGSDDEASFFPSYSAYAALNALEEFISDQSDYHGLPQSHYIPFHAFAEAIPLLVKRVPDDSPEHRLVLFLNSPPHRADPDNPAPELVHVVERGTDTFLVVEEKTPLEDAVMESDEKAGFVRQMLRYITFLHTHHITSLDLSASNILVNRSPFGDVYEILNYASSIRFSDAASRTSVRAAELTHEHAPEATEGACDPFKVDMWALGKLFEEIDLDGTGLEGLLDALLAQDPGGRPTAAGALEMFFAMTGE